MAAGTQTNITTHSESSFNPEVYSQYYNGNFLSDPIRKTSSWILDHFHNIFKSGALNGKRLLDIGTGPVVHPVITASEWFEEIYLSDVSEANIEYLQKWRRGESEHMKWLMEYFSEKDGKREIWQILNTRVLNKTKAVVRADVRNANPLSGTAIDDMEFDVITTCMCLQTATLTIEAFKSALQNISKLLKPGGHLVVIDAVDQSSYIVGDKTFRCLSSNPEEVQRAYMDSGYLIEYWDSVRTMLIAEGGNTLYAVKAKKQ